MKVPSAKNARFVCTICNRDFPIEMQTTCRRVCKPCQASDMRRRRAGNRVKEFRKYASPHVAEHLAATRIQADSARAKMIAKYLDYHKLDGFTLYRKTNFGTVHVTVSGRAIMFIDYANRYLEALIPYLAGYQDVTIYYRKHAWSDELYNIVQLLEQSISTIHVYCMEGDTCTPLESTRVSDSES